MSFSSEVKEELSRHLGKSRHCQIAELAALIAFDGKVQVSESGCDLFLDSVKYKVRSFVKKTVRFFGGEKRKIRKRTEENL